ncbi:A1pp-domain-containing protein [Setomelanomma holmii]|uniref:A1pp-domain-containing protein n=1 Tax=Setomelanomma holmii TaxID=210430 RepID=A0A9P4HHM4_9PLEO|nr:A1pp-domain-containing protein [Setomelanomma holmii]
MSSAYYLAKSPTASFRSSTPPNMAPIALDEIPTLSLLYKLKKIDAPGSDAPSPFPPSASRNDRISVIRQDITTLVVDAIVNAANNSLLGGGGVDGAIHRAAGPELLDECETLDGCETGSAKITEGYELPSKKVIHAVGPIYWKEGRSASAELLAGCYRTSLELAVEHGCKSIAFSALSTGIYGYPSGEASLVALETVRKFIDKEETATKLDRVIFCNFLQKDEDAYFENIPTFFPPVEDEDESAKEQETSTEPSEMLSQLPDAPTKEPKDIDDTPQPSTKKQKTEDAGDDFVVVEKEDAEDDTKVEVKEDAPKSEL